MARITGVFTGWKGKVGNVVFSMWKGIQVAKTKVIPENPQTPGQITNRTLWALFVAMFRVILIDLAHKFWNPFEGSRNSGWAKLIGENMLEQAGSVIDYEKVIVSKGALPGEDILTATYDTATGIVVVTWEETCGGGGSTEDSSQLIAYNKDTNKWCFDKLFPSRGDETSTVTFPAGLDVTDVIIFLFFFTEDPETGKVNAVSTSKAQESIAPVP
jgi:hypothetical protein